MLMFTHGADPVRVREVAQDLTQQGREVGQARELCTRAISTLKENWGGPDMDRFAAEWSRHERAITEAAAQLTHLSKVLEANAQAQEKSSSADDDAAGASGDGAPVAAPGADDGIMPEITRTNDDEGKLAPGVWSRFTMLDEPTKIRVLHKIHQRVAREMGMPDVGFSVYDTKDPWPYDELGHYNPKTNSVAIDSDNLWASSIVTVAHEMRHAQQLKAIDQFRNRPGDPWPFPQITREEARELSNAYAQYESDKAKGFGGYRDNILEADAREAGRRFAPTVSKDDLEQMIREARQEEAADRAQMPRGNGWPNPQPGPPPRPPR